MGYYYVRWPCHTANHHAVPTVTRPMWRPSLPFSRLMGGASFTPGLACILCTYYRVRRECRQSTGMVTCMGAGSRPDDHDLDFQTAINSRLTHQNMRLDIDMAKLVRNLAPAFYRKKTGRGGVSSPVFNKSNRCS